MPSVMPCQRFALVSSAGAGLVNRVSGAKNLNVVVDAWVRGGARALLALGRLSDDSPYEG